MKSAIENRTASGVDRLVLRADITINGVHLTSSSIREGSGWLGTTLVWVGGVVGAAWKGCKKRV